MIHAHRRFFLQAHLTAAVAVLSGCASGDYLFRQGIGQLGVLARSLPIDDVLKTGGLSDEQQRKLRLIIEVREYAHEQLGLKVGASFQKFHDTAGRPMAYNLSACRKDSLEPKRWWFPIVGWIDYIGYFEKADAHAAETALIDQGYDTWLREVDAASTLGWLPDPVHSPLLLRDEGSLVEVVCHELAHNTVYAAGHSDFSESLATFIGRQGALRFYDEKRPKDSAAKQALQGRYADEEIVNQWLIDLREALGTHYGQKLSSEEKIQGRDAVFEAARTRFRDEVMPRLSNPDRYKRWANMPTNNALVRLNMRYNLRQDAFERLFEKCGRDFRLFTRELRSAASSPDPFAEIERRAAQP